ncbi:MAG: WYL domain-containing protein [Clostridia bacterium]|nr:WYL domain-containing protein [Clostridia bacterium]
MYTKQAKKSMIINILDILKKYTDEDHRLSQKDIVDILKRDYDMTVDRKAVRRNIGNLIDCGYEIEYTETVRKVKNKKTGELEDTEVWSDYYLVRDFTDGELRLLIDSLLFSKHIPYSQCKELVEKLEGLSNEYFRAHVKHIHTMPETLPQNKQLLYTIEILDEAIEAGKQVSFRYYEYGTDKELHYRQREDGSVREYIMNPYQMAAKEGKYYLICNNDKYDGISNYRIDRIADIQMLDTPVKPYESLPDSAKGGLDLAGYMREHVYMFASKSTRVRFRITKRMISDVIDMFGRDIEFSDETEDHVCVSAVVNDLAMCQFAKTYMPDVVVLEPKEVALSVRSDAEELLEAYS